MCSLVHKMQHHLRMCARAVMARAVTAAAANARAHSHLPARNPADGRRLKLRQTPSPCLRCRNSCPRWWRLDWWRRCWWHQLVWTRTEQSRRRSCRWVLHVPEAALLDYDPQSSNCPVYQPKAAGQQRRSGSWSKHVLVNPQVSKTFESVFWENHISTEGQAQFSGHRWDNRESRSLDAARDLQVHGKPATKVQNRLKPVLQP